MFRTSTSHVVPQPTNIREKTSSDVVIRVYEGSNGPPTEGRSTKAPAEFRALVALKLRAEEARPRGSGPPLAHHWLKSESLPSVTEGEPRGFLTSTQTQRGTSLPAS